jgi:nucleotide-binding universal stress UspA family protein
MAAALAARFEARLSLIYVQMLPAMMFVGGPPPQSVLDDMDAQARALLEEWRRDAVALGAAQTEATLAYGVAFDEIVRFADARRADVLVLGTHGRTSLKHVLLGSVAEKVVRYARCPVLTLHGDEGLQEGTGAAAEDAPRAPAP